VTIKTVYQTLEDRGNVDYVENNGPFACTRSNAWLGGGFYFWDTSIKIAHWWGTEGGFYSSKNGYMICKAHYTFDDEKCFNLVDNAEHLEIYNSTKDLLVKQGLFVTNQTTVARVIEHIKNTLKIFSYEAIRAYGVNSINKASQYANRTNFAYKNGQVSFQYLDSLPAIQICFYAKTSLNLSKVKVVYPDEYNEDYVG
jgi:hypothetical protein